MNGIQSLLRRADARGSAHIITVCKAYHYFAGQAYSVDINVSK